LYFVPCISSQVLERLSVLERKGAMQFVFADGSHVQGVLRAILLVGDHPELQLLCGMMGAWNADHPCRFCMVSLAHTYTFFRRGEERGEGQICQPRSRKATIAAVSHCLFKSFNRGTGSTCRLASGHGAPHVALLRWRAVLSPSTACRTHVLQQCYDDLSDCTF
jgi:hypothetical protein